jgi:hypothetical protein
VERTKITGRTANESAPLVKPVSCYDIFGVRMRHVMQRRDRKRTVPTGSESKMIEFEMPYTSRPTHEIAEDSTTARMTVTYRGRLHSASFVIL